jgi:hypothetical protein
MTTLVCLACNQDEDVEFEKLGETENWKVRV